MITVHPGFVKTKMTKDIKTIELLTATPDKVAMDIFKGQQSNKSIIYYWKIYYVDNQFYSRIII